MIVVIDTNHLLRLAAAMKRSPLFAAWRNGRFDDADLSRRLQAAWHIRVVEPAEFLAVVS